MINEDAIIAAMNTGKSGSVEQLSAVFQATHGRQPTGKELDAMY